MMTDRCDTLPGLHDMVWQTLSRGVADHRSPARQPTFATISPTGWPEARTVVLRRASPSDAVLEVYTDSQSDKIASLRQTPRAALHVWHAKQRLQIRVQADVTLLSGTAVTDRWTPLGPEGRLSYGVAPPPGQAIATSLAYEKQADPDRFCVLSLAVTTIDAVHLGDVHRRASFAASDGWVGCWLSP